MMNLTRAAALTVLACAGLLAADMAAAQARGPRSAPRQVAPEPADEAVAREAKLAEMDAWLRRLVGHFRFEGDIQVFVLGCDSHGPCMIPGLVCESFLCFLHLPSPGVGDCINIGTGPGVHCVINVPWPESMLIPLPSGTEIYDFRWPARLLAPAMMLYGIDPDNLEIRYLLVDSKSISESVSGVLKGETVTFTTRCVNNPSTCRQTFSVRAPRSGRGIMMSMEIERLNGYGFYQKMAGYEFTLRRLHAAD